jgi:diguanylate cyclase (GGDEF)-like protein
MRPRRVSVKLTKWSVGLKFAVAVGAVVLGMIAVFLTAVLGLIQLRSDIERLAVDDLTGVRAIGDLALGLYTTEKSVLTELAAGPGQTDETALLDQMLLPRLREQLDITQQRFAGDDAATRRLTQVGRDLDGYLELRRTSDPATSRPADHLALVTRVASTFDRMTTEVGAVRDATYHQTGQSAEEARSSYSSTVAELVGGTAASLLVALTVVLLLVRDVVPRLRSYARFATDVAADRRTGALNPRGYDELAELGRALDEMVVRTDTARQRDVDQAEFADTLQVTASEEEAHELVQRHLERSLPGSAVVVLTRNNSENRLEAATSLVPGSALTARLPGAEPRACLALRFGRTHREDPGRVPLLSCLLCAEHGARSTCEPLLVGGQVIGSVLVAHQDMLETGDEARVKNSVAQAAPVLGNLRNLALAEFRANNDSLTGLPNKRATDDTLKRMVAQANRSVTPLTAAMLDLDHFKQINDRFGHAKGDEVLAAVGAALRSCLRASDFAGRFGGEELLVLLPDTTAEDAVALAERIRGSVAEVRVPGVEVAVTVSIGLADLIQHGGDAPGLLRQADRALYTAKATGRNRVVVAGTEPDVDEHDQTGGPAGAGDPASVGVGAGAEPAADKRVVRRR